MNWFPLAAGHLSCVSPFRCMFRSPSHFSIALFALCSSEPRQAKNVGFLKRIVICISLLLHFFPFCIKDVFWMGIGPGQVPSSSASLHDEVCTQVGTNLVLRVMFVHLSCEVVQSSSS